jgi:hypothetical protein
MLEMLQTGERDTRLSRLWRLLVAWEAALNSDPIERLEQRVSALERAVRDGQDHQS